MKAPDDRLGRTFLPFGALLFALDLKHTTPNDLRLLIDTCSHPLQRPTLGPGTSLMHSFLV